MDIIELIQKTRDMFDSKRWYVKGYNIDYDSVYRIKFQFSRQVGFELIKTHILSNLSDVFTIDDTCAKRITLSIEHTDIKYIMDALSRLYDTSTKIPDRLDIIFHRI